MLLPLLRRIHRWVGLLIALPIALQGLTGTVLALAALVPDQHTTMALARPVGEIVAAARLQMGDGARAIRYIAPQGFGYEAQVEVGAANGPPRMVHIDPATLTVLTVDPPGGNLFAWIRALHENLWAAAYGGRSVIGWFGIGLLTMLLTAIPIWWPRDGRPLQAFVPALRVRGVLFHRRLHGAAGIWIIFVLTILTITGIVMAFPRTARIVLGLEQREPPRPRQTGDAFVMPPADIDHVVALAKEAVPDAVLRVAILPLRQTDPVRLIFNEFGENGAVNAIQLQANAADNTARVLDDPASRKPAETLYRWMHDIHTGSGIGGWWRIGASFGGIALPLLSLSGWMMWWRKRSARRLKNTRGDPAGTAKGATG